MNNLAKSVVEKILDDLTDRRGLRHEWERLDDDVKDEIRQKWEEIVKDEARKLRKKP